MDNLCGGKSGATSGQPPSPDRTVLVICPTHRDYRELPLLALPSIKYLSHDYPGTSLEDLIANPACRHSLAADPLVEIEAILAKVAGLDVAAVISSDDYPGSVLAAAVAKRLGLPGPEPEVVLVCQHKYLSRLAQARLVPESVPPFALIDVAEPAAVPEGLGFPLFVKPVKSFFSIGAGAIASVAELAALLPPWATLDQFFLPLDRMLQRFAGARIGTQRLIAEGLLEGQQVTVEGYVHGGTASIIGVVDSVMFPGTLAFSRFDYPSSLPEGVQARMGEIASRLMQGLGFDDGLFNIEMMYDRNADRISVIEINPRMASQFADLYEKVDGTNSYMVLLDVAQGRAPRFSRRRGPCGFASSFVLRSFDDHLVAAIPSEADLARLAQRHPGIRVELHARPGRKLSEEFQDGRSYRYGIVNLGGRDRADALEQFEACRERLGIALLPVTARGEPVAGLPLEALTEGSAVSPEVNARLEAVAQPDGITSS